jgi:hypothetical protein
MNHVIPHATVAGGSASPDARRPERRPRLVEWMFPPSAFPSTWAGRTALLVAAMTLLHGIVAATTGLSDTEAYYAQWARVPALSYYDHPPLIAWTTWLTTRASRAPWAVRLGPVLYAAALDALVYRLAARLFSRRAAFLSVAVLSAIPAFFFTGFLLNPEALLTPLWALYLLLLLDLRDHDASWRMIAVGAVVGVAFLAKYTAVLAVPVTLIHLAGSAPTRRWLRRPSLLLAGVVALAMASPVIAWNASHGWPSWQLHLSERMTRPQGESLGGALVRVARGQMLLFSPLFQPALVGVLGVAVVRSWRDERYRLVAVASLPVLVFLLSMMVRAGDSEPHWTMVGYLPLVVASGAILDGSAGPVRRVAGVAFGAAFLLSAAAAVLYAVHVGTPALAERLPFYDPRADPLAETLGWDRVRAVVRAHAAELGPGAVVVGAHNVLCGHVEAALDDRPAVYCASPRRTEFDFTGRRTPPGGAPVVFVDSERYPADRPLALPDRVCRPPEEIAIERSGLHQALFHVRDCLPVAASSP